MKFVNHPSIEYKENEKRIAEDREHNTSKELDMSEKNRPVEKQQIKFKKNKDNTGKLKKKALFLNAFVVA